MNDFTLEQMAQKFSTSKSIVILTGAGVSTASGLQDYRSHGGLWDGKDPLEISHISKVGTKEFMKFFEQRFCDVYTHEPNSIHETIQEWQKDHKVTVITQNIDHYHGDDAIELHGHLECLVCSGCKEEYPFEEFTVMHNDVCLQCGSTLRPPVVLFGENLDMNKWMSAIHAIVTADFVISMGTSLEVSPFNELVDMALDYRTQVAILTASDTPYDGKASFRSHDDLTAIVGRLNTRIRQLDKQVSP